MEGKCPASSTNIDQSLLPALRQTLEIADRADFCVGYFNLRGWKAIDACVERWSGGPGHCCRLLVGMQQLPESELRSAIGFGDEANGMDNQTAVRLKQRLAAEFREQLMVGTPNAADEARTAASGAADPRGQGRREVVLAPPAPRQAVPAVPPRPRQPHRRLPGQQQPHPRRPVAAGRAERRRAGPRRLPEARAVVRGPLERPLVRRHLRRSSPRSSTRAGPARS